MMFFLYLILLTIPLYYIFGVFDIRKNIYINSINSGKKGSIYLTFDDGPDAELTPIILDILHKHCIKATFFLIGVSIQKNQEIVKRIHKEGHEIGCHTYNHKSTFPLYSQNNMEIELIKTNSLITAITSNKSKLFRPPYGVTNPNISKVLKKLEMISIGWDVRSLDTVLSNSNVLYERVIRGIEKGGSIILFHDRCNSTIESLENIINYCQKNNLQFKTITEIIDEK